MNIKIYYLFRHLDRFSENLGELSEELGEIQDVPEYMTQFQNFIKNKQVKIQRKLKYFLKGYEMPFQFSSLRQCRCSFEAFLEN